MLAQSNAYAEAVKESIRAMHAQVSDLCFTGDELARSGILLRYLVMPGHKQEGKAIVY